MTDIAVLRRFAAALAIRPQVFGLAPEPQAPQSRQAGPFPVTAGSPRLPCSTVAVNPGQEDGEDPVPRKLRVLLGTMLRDLILLGALSERYHVCLDGC
jgi:hypothetical protein